MLSSLVSLFSGMTVLCCFLSKLKIIVSHIQPSFLVVYGELASLVLINPSWLELENFQAIFLLYFCFPNVLNFYVVRFNYSPIQFVPFKSVLKKLSLTQTILLNYLDHTSTLLFSNSLRILFYMLRFLIHIEFYFLCLVQYRDLKLFFSDRESIIPKLGLESSFFFH